MVSRVRSFGFVEGDPVSFLLVVSLVSRAGAGLLQCPRPLQGTVLCTLHDPILLLLCGSTIQ